MTLRERYNALPRAARWAVLAGAVIVVYFALIEPALTLKSEMDAEGDASSAVLRAAQRQARAGVERALDVRRGRERFGEVLLPAGPDEAGIRERTLAFAQRITEVLDRHGVRGRQETSPVSGRVPAGPLVAYYAGIGDLVLTRVVRDVEFTASPETVAAVLADLESTPEITAIGRVQIRRAEGRGEGSGREVTATISAETWVVGRRGGS